MIARLAARGHSTAFKEDTANYIEFVRKWAGGTDGEHLVSLDLFVKGLQVHREIPSEFYKQLASVPMASAPEYVIALVKASLSAPEKYIVNQKARLFTTQDLVRLTKDKRLEVQKAHKVMRQARVLLSSADVGDSGEGADEPLLAPVRAASKEFRSLAVRPPPLFFLFSFAAKVVAKPVVTTPPATPPAPA